MANEYIHYVKRKIQTRYPKDPGSPWFAELHDYDFGFDTPAYHVTRANNWPIDEIEKNDVIWLISELSSPWGKLPVCLDGRIVVKSMEKIELDDGKEKQRFSAGKGSEWFPLRNTLENIKKIEITKKDKSVYPPMQKDNAIAGQEFQSIKMINNPELLHEIREELIRSPYDFISYRVADGTKPAFSHAKGLLENGTSVFWDRWSLPRRLAERRELVSDLALDSFLLNKMSNAENIWGIESKKYSEQGSYSKKEKMVALELKKYVSVYIES